MDTQAKIGIIGGTGLSDRLLKEADGKPVEISTPFGAPSSAPIIAQWEGVDVAFLQRHGPGHCFNPSQVPYRANIWALKMLGVHTIIASGATGSLRDDIAPGDVVICDQVIDKTFRRDGTFFDDGPVVHVELADPFCGRVRDALCAAGDACGVRVHAKGTYICMEGPQFSTRAESRMHRAWGGDLIGMTCMPEAKLAREAEICYALIGLPTDYDCWRDVPAGRPADALIAEILGNLKRATESAIPLIRGALRALSSDDAHCPCRSALELAIWSDRAGIDVELRKRLAPLIGRYVDGDNG